MENFEYDSDEIFCANDSDWGDIEVGTDDVCVEKLEQSGSREPTSSKNTVSLLINGKLFKIVLDTTAT